MVQRTDDIPDPDQPASPASGLVAPTSSPAPTTPASAPASAPFPTPSSGPAPTGEDANRLLPWPLRAVLILIAVLSLATGVIGLFLPGLPTTVFVLIAAACAARSSPRFHGWLLAHRLFGPMIRNWQQGGRVSRPAKRAATISMAVCALILVAMVEQPLVFLPLAIMATVLVWLWHRPEPQDGPSDCDKKEVDG